MYYKYKILMYYNVYYVIIYNVLPYYKHFIKKYITYMSFNCQLYASSLYIETG